MSVEVRLTTNILISPSVRSSSNEAPSGKRELLLSLPSHMLLIVTRDVNNNNDASVTKWLIQLSTVRMGVVQTESCLLRPEEQRIICSDGKKVRGPDLLFTSECSGWLD